MALNGPCATEVTYAFNSCWFTKNKKNRKPTKHSWAINMGPIHPLAFHDDLSACRCGLATLTPLEPQALIAYVSPWYLGPENEQPGIALPLLWTPCLPWSSCRYFDLKADPVLPQAPQFHKVTFQHYGAFFLLWKTSTLIDNSALIVALQSETVLLN